MRLRAFGGGWLRALVSDRYTWASVVFLLLRLPLGILDFTVAASVLALALGGLAQPIMVAAGLETQIGSWTIDTFAESLYYLPFSMVFLLAGPRLFLGWSAVSRRAAVSLLGYVDARDLKRAVADILARAPETDSFQIHGALRQRFGPTPWLTITRIEATLLTLDRRPHQVQSSRSSHPLRVRPTRLAAFTHEGEEPENRSLPNDVHYSSK